MTTPASPAVNPVSRKSSLSRLTQVFVISLLAALTLGAGPSFQPVSLVYRQAEGTFLKGPRGVFVDRAHGDIYVADTQNDLVAVYSRNGVPLFAFGYNGEIKEPIKAVTDASGRIYVLAGRTVKIFNYRGEYLRDFPFRGTERGVVPTAISAFRDEVYIADSTSGQVLVYDGEFRVTRRFGDEGQLKAVAALTIAPDGTVYLVDANATTALRVYGADGKYLRGWGEHQAGPQNFSLPSGIAVDADGNVITVDMIRQQISVFSSDGAYQARFGGLGTQPGAVSFPSDVAIDGTGRLYVVERQGNRLQIFEPRVASERVRPSGTASRVPALVRESLKQAIGESMRSAQ